MTIEAGKTVRASDVAIKACHVTRTSAQSMADGTTTTVAFNSERDDTDGMHDNTTNNTRITIITAGWYSLGFNGILAAAADYTRHYAALTLNGVSTELARNQSPGTSASVLQTLSVHKVCRLDAGDYVQVVVFQDNTANVARDLEQTDERSPEFYAVRIGG